MPTCSVVVSADHPLVADSVRTALEVARELGDKLWGVRLDTSESLVDRSLVVERRHGSSTRYSLLETVRGVPELSIVTFTEADVLRHPLVQRIVEAYDRRDRRKRRRTREP